MLSCGEGLNSKPCCYPPCSLQYGKLALNIDVKKCHFLWLNKRKESWDQDSLFLSEMSLLFLGLDPELFARNSTLVSKFIGDYTLAHSLRLMVEDKETKRRMFKPLNSEYHLVELLHALSSATVVECHKFNPAS